MKKQFTSSSSESDGCFRPFLDNPGLFKKIVMDTNVAAQESGVAALVAFLEFGDTHACSRIRGTVVGPLVEKALGSTRAGTRQNAIDALLWFVELDTPDPVVEEMIPFLSHRTPKVVVATLKGLSEIFGSFGAKTVSPKPLIKHFPKLFAHADKNVRAETSALLVELYKWLGDPLASQVLEELKPVQKKELEEQFEKVKGEQVHQKRYLKSQREALERQQASGIDQGSGASNDTNSNELDPEDDDPMDFIDPVEVLSKVPQDLTERLSSTKWKDRKEVLEELYAVINKPKIQQDDFGDIVRLLAKCMKDANVQVVVLAANSIQCLANGLRDGFHKYQSMVLTPILERTREKKASVSEALAGALDAVFKAGGATITDFLEPVLEYLKHKTPQVKIETSKFLIRCLSTTKSAPRPPELKAIAEAAVALLGDTQEPVRSAGAEILGVLMKMFGERPMNAFLDSVDDIKKANIAKFCESATVVAKPAASKPAAKPAPPSASQSSAAGPPAGRKLAQPTRVQRKDAGGEQKPLSTPSRTSQVISRKRLANSPLKTPQAPREISRGASEEPPASAGSAAPPPRFGLQGRGLTSRSLVPPSRTNSSSANAAAAAESSAKIASLEKELEQLRAEKTEWLREKEQLTESNQQYEAQAKHLVQENTTLRNQNAQLIDEHTKDMITFKSRETHMVRVQSDLENAQDRIRKLEQQLQVQSSTESSAGGVTGHGRTMSNTSRTSSASSRDITSPKSPYYRSHHRGNIRRSVDFSAGGGPDRSSLYLGRPVSMYSDDKENLGLAIKNSGHLDDGFSSRSVSGGSGKGVAEEPAEDGDGDTAMVDAPSIPQTTSSTSSTASSYTANSNPGENWKRAVEVTTQLRARIEAMKARQDRAVKG